MRTRIQIAGLTSAVMMGLIIGCEQKRTVVTERTTEGAQEVVYTEPPERGVIVVQEEPPAPIMEVRTAAPGPDYVWTEGYYTHDGRHYAWKKGHYERLRRGHHYVATRWEHTPHGWEYHRERWERD